MNAPLILPLGYPKMDFKSIKLIEQSAAKIARVSEADGFFLNSLFNNDFRLREEVCERLKKAQAHLPQGLAFILYEAYRPLSRQIAMWGAVQDEMRGKYLDLPPTEFEALCETFIANPYDGIGSGHQAACAVDITLCTQMGEELDMGASMHAFGEFTETDAKGLSESAQTNRRILKDAMEAEGFLNYPAEWWHYSYGDHGWAWLAGKSEALYGPLNLSAPENQL